MHAAHAVNCQDNAKASRNAVAAAETQESARAYACTCCHAYALTLFHVPRPPPLALTQLDEILANRRVARVAEAEKKRIAAEETARKAADRKARQARKRREDKVAKEQAAQAAADRAAAKQKLQKAALAR